MDLPVEILAGQVTSKSSSTRTGAVITAPSCPMRATVTTVLAIAATAATTAKLQR